MGNEQSKKAKKILEDKKKALANLTNKKDKQDKIHSALNQDINKINNSVIVPNHQMHNFSQANNQQSYSNERNQSEFTDNYINRNNSFNTLYKNSDNTNQMNIDNEISHMNNLNAKRNHSANRMDLCNQNNQMPNNANLENISSKGNVSKSVFIPKIFSKNTNNNNNNSNFDLNKNEKLAKDLEIMDKLVEKYKIMYLDSYYFKRDKNYNQAIERNLEGQEYIEKLLNILYQKKEKEYNKHINICKNLQIQFITLMEEIQSDMQSQGKNVDSIINEIHIQKKQSSSSTNLNDINKINLNNQNQSIQNYNENNNRSKYTNIYDNNIRKNNFDKNNQNESNQNMQNHKSNIPQEILERIKSEILDKNPKVRFDEVVGLDLVKQALKEIIIIPNLRPDLFTGLRTPAKGLLLFGPPGTGKTLIAKAVATECKSVFFNISASSLTSKYVGESEKLVKALFEVARYPENQPAIIFIDEIESILSKRSENENEVSKRLKTEFLVQFDGVATSSNDRILVIGATNRPQDLDAAVIRRLPKKIFVGPMDFKGRANFIFEILSKSKTEHSLNQKEFSLIAQMTENYSNSDLKELCRQACIEPIRELKEGQLEKIDKLRPICFNDFAKAVKAVRGTLSPEMLGEYLQWNKENGALN